MHCKFMICIVFFLLSAISYAMEQSPVIACHFDAISKNADASQIIYSAVAHAGTILSGFSWRTIAALTMHVSMLKKRSLEIAENTYGISNIIKRLFVELEAADYGHFSEDNIRALTEAAVRPVPEKFAISILQRIKDISKIPVIGFGNKDSIEYDLYSNSMLQNYGINFGTLFDGVVTVPSYTETMAGYCGPAAPAYERSNRWLVSRDPHPSQGFNTTVQTLAQKFVQRPQIITINDSVDFLPLCVSHTIPVTISPSGELTDDSSGDDK